MLKSKEVKGVLLFGASVLLAGSANAQGLGNSPYSRLGLGEYNANTGGVRQMGMGGVGLATPNSTNVNELNPALLYYVGRTTFEAGYTGQYKTVKNATASSRSGSGTLGYLALAVPLSTKWAAAVGLKPLSAVDYESNVVERVIGDPDARVLNQYQGTGGIAEAYLAQGYRIAKHLSLGFTASYVFGTVDQTTGTAIQLPNGGITNRVVERDHIRYSDFIFKAGAHYRQKLSEKLQLNLGGVYTFPTSVRGTLLTTQERQDANGAVLGLPVETANGRGSSVLPALAQAGISIDNGRNWSVSLDAAQQDWSKFESFGSTATPLSNTVRVALGSEFVPDPSSVEHYFRRVSYRAGLSVAQLPYRPGGQVLYDRAVSWGFAFPLPSATPMDATTFSLAFTYGMRGNTELLSGGSGSNVQENYIKGQLGITLNNRWFIKRRLQ